MGGGGCSGPSGRDIASLFIPFGSVPLAVGSLVLVIGNGVTLRNGSWGWGIAGVVVGALTTPLSLLLIYASIASNANGVALATSFFRDKPRPAPLVRVDDLAKLIGRHGLSRGPFSFFRSARSSR